MKLFRSLGRLLKPLVNVSAWIGWKSLKQDSEKIGQLAKDVFFQNRPEVHAETFEEAVKRLRLDEAALLARQQYFKRIAIIYALIAVGVFLYSFYILLVLKALLGFVVTLVVTWVVLTLAFRQHFWYVQMRERRLGLSFKEWLSIALRTTKGMRT